MSAARTVQSYRRVMASQWRNRSELESLQEQKLRRVVGHAYANVPYYRSLFDDAGVDPESIRGLEDLPRIPITSKRDLQRLSCPQVVDQRYSADDLCALRSSGSTGSPFTVYIDSRFHSIRNALFLRALRTAGYTFGKRLMLVTTANPKARSRPLLRWRYASITDPAEVLLEDFRNHRPHFLYGCVTPLRLLAEILMESDEPTPQLKAVLTAAETLDLPTRSLLESTFGCHVYDLYGLTEMGIVGWECEVHHGLHLSEETILVEEVPMEEHHELHRLVMTNLDSLAMPFVRFDSGDIGHLDSTHHCSCGRTTALLESVEGRLVDCVHLPDGQRLSPYSLTSAIETVPGVERYRIVQTERGALEVEIEISRLHPLPEPESRVRALLEAILGHQVPVQVTERGVLPPLLGEKFRLVECHYQGN